MREATPLRRAAPSTSAALGFGRPSPVSGETHVVSESNRTPPNTPGSGDKVHAAGVVRKPPTLDIPIGNAMPRLPEDTPPRRHKDLVPCVHTAWEPSPSFSEAWLAPTTAQPQLGETVWPSGLDAR